MFAADLAAVPFLADNLEAEPVCVAQWHLIWLAASAAPSTDCAPAAQHETPSRQGSGCCRCRCSHRGCRPSPLAALAAVVVVSASAGLGVGGGPHFFRRCQEGQGIFRAGLAVLLGRALVTARVACGAAR